MVGEYGLKLRVNNVAGEFRLLSGNDVVTPFLGSSSFSLLARTLADHEE
jgi:hypothetical protein